MTISGFAAYIKQLWKNKPDTSTPVSAERLGHIEDGIKGNSDAIEAIAAAVLDSIINDPNKIASMAAVYALQQNLQGQITTLNSKLSIFSLGRCLTLGASESITFTCNAASIFFLYRGISAQDKTYIFAVDNWAVDIGRAVKILATDELVTTTYADKKLTITNNNTVGLTIMYFATT